MDSIQKHLICIKTPDGLWTTREFFFDDTQGVIKAMFDLLVLSLGDKHFIMNELDAIIQQETENERGVRL